MKTIPYGNIWHAVKSNFITDDVFLTNEAAANRFAARTMLLLSALLALSWGLNFIGVFSLDRGVFNSLVFWSILELTIPAGICLHFKGEKRWLKYLLMLEFTIVEARIDSVLSFNVELAMLIPLVLSCRYFSQSFTRQIAVFTTILFAVSAFCGAWFDMAEYNLMYQAATKAAYVRNIMIQFFLPKWFVFVLVSVVCSEISKWGRNMVLKQADISREHSRVETELDMARRIQNRALPIVHTLPQKDQPLFDLAASMEPAKEVGGDFYDFFYQDETHLVLMIADVSGKGVPAALFMMASKLLLDNSIASHRSPGYVLQEVNHQLCEKNLENMFVTVWLGILDLESGDLTSASAGHEYPLICRKDGSFTAVHDKHGFVLGGMDAVHFPETRLHLDPGDILFVYTDGVPEANNPGQEQFGMERMLQSLNSCTDRSMEDLTNHLKADISSFVECAPQFDDTTMLALRVLRYAEQDGLNTAADMASIEKAADYVRQTMNAAGVTARYANKVSIVVDEIYSNIVRYSGASWANVSCKVQEGTVTLTFRDNGTPYDPTKEEEPDVEAPLEEREIGGLGVFMTKAMADSISYCNDDSKNCLTIRIKYQQSCV